MSEHWRLSLSDGLRQMEEGDLTSTEWVRSLLSRIDACEEEVKAWVRWTRKARSRRRRRWMTPGAPGRSWAPGRSALCDQGYFGVRGLKLEAGTEIFKGRTASEDAACVARLRSAGAIALGKAVTTPFAQGDPPSPQSLELERSPGGRAAAPPRPWARHGARRVRQPDDGLHASSRRVLRRTGPEAHIWTDSQNGRHRGFLALRSPGNHRAHGRRYRQNPRSGGRPGWRGSQRVAVPPACCEPDARKPEKIAYLKDLLALASEEVVEWTERAVARIDRRASPSTRWSCPWN